MIKLVEREIGGLIRSVIIKLVDKKTGKVVKEIEIDKRYDLGTNNLGRFLKSLFTEVDEDAKLEADYVNTSGATVTVRTAYSTEYTFVYTGYGKLFRKIKVGDSSVAASRDQYNLQGTILGESPVIASYSDGSDHVDITGAFSWDTDQTIYEIGLFFGMSCFDTASVEEIMFDRTVYPDGISVPAGQVLYITYRFQI